VAPFFLEKIMTDQNNEELRPSKMRGVAFPKAKYGVIAAVIIIVVVNLIYYKDFLLSLFK
jgi:retron-type reverse transcriptase